MPRIFEIGQPSAANEIVGGVPDLHYFDIPGRGRGQYVRTFLEDAGIAFKDVRYSFAELPAAQEAQLKEKNPMKTIPILTFADGRVLTSSLSLMRLFSNQLGKYDGSTIEEKYWVDMISDLNGDWRAKLVAAFFSPEKETLYPIHAAKARPVILNALQELLASSPLASGGPYVLGATITYADFIFFQNMHDEDLTHDEGREELSKYPRLMQLLEAMEARPAIKAALERVNI